jgi:hypothetical protein
MESPKLLVRWEFPLEIVFGQHPSQQQELDSELSHELPMATPMQELNILA